MPNQVDDVRGRMLPHVEGHSIGEARAFLGRNGFRCDEPLPSATDAHAHVCRAIAQDAGWSRWTVALIERNGRVADVQARQ